MFGSRRTEAVLAALQAENSDLRQQLRHERAQFAEERQSLLDRLLASMNPSALREVRRAPARESMPSPFPEPKRRRLHYPGSGAPTMRPPDPPTPSAPGAVPLTDSQLLAIATSSDSITSEEKN